MLPAWVSYCLSIKSFGHQSLRSTMFYILPLVLCLAYTVYFGGSCPVSNREDGHDGFSSSSIWL
ncbi:hypothetical protein HN873_067227, partial [Arachis hypogaea]